MGIVIYALPGSTIELTWSNAPAGLVALNSVGVRILDDLGNTLAPGRMNTGITEFPAGSGHYARPTAVPSTLGEYSVMWDSDVGGLATPANSYVDKLVVTTDLVVPVIPIPTPPGSGPTLGPCESWITADDVRRCCVVDGDSTTITELLDRFSVSASQVLYELSGRRFSGVCASVVRPCQTQGCGMSFLPGLGVLPSWGGGYWAGLGSGWQDLGIGNAGVQCGCAPLSQILLGYPVVDILEVLIDGVVVPASTYRVDEWRYLIRTANPTTTPPTPRYWPSCQNLMVDATELGTFQVTYTHGIAPPAIGQDAAAQLACQFFTQCQGGDCVLPVGATRITRQGVTIERGLLATWFYSTSNGGGGGWNTGMAAVDAFLTAYNPGRLRRAPAIFTPDLPRMPRNVGTSPQGI